MQILPYVRVGAPTDCCNSRITICASLMRKKHQFTVESVKLFCCRDTRVGICRAQLHKRWVVLWAAGESSMQYESKVIKYKRLTMIYKRTEASFEPLAGLFSWGTSFISWIHLQSPVSRLYSRAQTLVSMILTEKVLFSRIDGAGAYPKSAVGT